MSTASLPPAPSPALATRITLGTVLFTFIAYLTIGIPLAVLPGYVHDQLGFNSIIAGLVISSQYLATLFSRSHAGRIIDTVGAKQSVLYGMLGCGLSGVLMLASVLLQAWPWVSLTALLLGRLVLGCAESLSGTGAISWAIGRVGPTNTAKVISWNGVASYGALAIGAPLGVVLVDTLGLWIMGVEHHRAGRRGLSHRQTPSANRPGARRTPALHHRAGSGPALRPRPGAGRHRLRYPGDLHYPLLRQPGLERRGPVPDRYSVPSSSVYAWSVPRHQPPRRFRVAIVSLAVEAVGLAVLWLAPSVTTALMGAALTGIGFSLVFPALAVEAVQRVPSSNRGAALAGYSVFIDLSLA